MDLIKELELRGFLYQCTDIESLRKLIESENISAYIGFDATAKSLHVGSLMQIMIFRLLQKYGHKPLVIIGGGTTKIGDPSFKDDARKMLSDEVIAENMSGIKDVIKKFINFGNKPTDAIMINNDDWLSNINYLDFLREIGAHFSVNRMLSFDSVKTRLEREQNLSFLEFNYMILQAYDFVELYKKYGCRLQIGGSDQWGNIVNGIDLGRRLGLKHDLFGMTTPLITTSSGIKMGKTMSGAVWLAEDMLSSYDYYQFWRNTEDLDVIKFMKLFTDLPLEEIENYAKLSGSDINIAKKKLAFEATKICHGEEKALESEETSKKIFEQGILGDNMPEYFLEKNILESGIPAYMLFNKSGLCSTGGEAKRLIEGGGAKINDIVVNDSMALVNMNDLKNDVIKISMGRKKHLAVKIA